MMGMLMNIIIQSYIHAMMDSTLLESWWLDVLNLAIGLIMLRHAYQLYAQCLLWWLTQISGMMNNLHIILLEILSLSRSCFLSASA